MEATTVSFAGTTRMMLRDALNIQVVKQAILSNLQKVYFGEIEIVPVSSNVINVYVDGIKSAVVTECHLRQGPDKVFGNVEFKDVRDNTRMFSTRIDISLREELDALECEVKKHSKASAILTGVGLVALVLFYLGTQL